jgi:uncharacterized protein
MLAVCPKQIVSMLTRDGVRLDADVYRPDAEGEFPVLLMRQPYGRAIASTVVYAHPIWYAAHGYMVVIQDVRGRGSSEGEFSLFASEIEDGLDTVNWAADLPGSSGQVGMYGFSYQGMTQLYAAATHPPALKTICPSMIGYDLYHDWAYEGGAFCYQLNLSWAIQLAAETARRRGDRDAYQSLYVAAQNPPLDDPVNPRSSLLDQFAPDSFYHDWLAHPEPDEYWQQLSPVRAMQTVDLPMLHIGGWFDPYLRGTMRLYREMATRSQFPQHLWVGPWAHLPWGRRVGNLDFGSAANSPIDRLQIRWFNQFLKGLDTGLLAEDPVHWFEMGSNQWRSLPAYPQPVPKSYFLNSTGLANISDQEGVLTESSPTESPSSQTANKRSPDLLVHDPWRPVPALGGHATFPSGVSDRASLDDRCDILTYTSAPLCVDLYLQGDVSLEIYCTADAPSFDLCAIFSAVKPDGRVLNLTQGYRRFTSNAQASSQPLLVSLQPTCVCISSGSALRLGLSAACFPAYAVNSGTGLPSGESRLIDARVITVKVMGGDRPSRILLPIRLVES